MASYEAAAVDAALRAEARRKLDELTSIVGQIVAGMDLPERIELGAYVAEGRRLLHGDMPPPAPAPGSNVRPIRVPFFKRRDLLNLESEP